MASTATEWLRTDPNSLCSSCQALYESSMVTKLVTHLDK